MKKLKNTKMIFSEPKSKHFGQKLENMFKVNEIDFGAKLPSKKNETVLYKV